jgi:hypothetical protein
LVYFMVIRYIFPVLVWCTKKNLAALAQTFIFYFRFFSENRFENGGNFPNVPFFSNVCTLKASFRFLNPVLAKCPKKRINNSLNKRQRSWWNVCFQNDFH